MKASWGKRGAFRPPKWGLAWRIQDKDKTWRIIYRIDADAVVIAEVFAKTSQATPKPLIETSRRRFRRYDEDAHGER